ncbi:hypothetical protein ACFL2Q_19475, partial [Thermodesulfobacteriota bacterium]
MTPNRITTDDGGTFVEQLDRLTRDLFYLQARYPFEWHDILDQLFLFDTNFGKLLHTSVTLGNPGHEITLDAPSPREAESALQVCNDLAARCFPLAGGLDGLVNVLLSQNCRTGGMACEWVPDPKLNRIERAFAFPVKTIRFRKDKRGAFILGQIQDMKFVALNILQVAF